MTGEELKVHTALVQKGLAELLFAKFKDAPPLARFVALLGTAGGEAVVMIRSEQDPKEREFMAAQLAARLLTLADLIMMVVPK